MHDTNFRDSGTWDLPTIPPWRDQGDTLTGGCRGAVEKIAKRKGRKVSEVVNDLIKTDMRLAEMLE